MENIDKARAIIRLIKRRWADLDHDVMKSAAELAAEKVRGQWAKKEWEDNCGGLGFNPRDRSSNIGRLEQNLKENQAELDVWQDIYDYAVEKFLEKGV